METSAKIKTVKEKKRRRKKKRPPHKSKMITGYIIYASEIRKDVIKKFPDRDFGDISKLVGIEWKNLPQETKAAYEKRAQEQNAKSKAIAAEAIEQQKLADEHEAATSKISLNLTSQLPTTPSNGFKINGLSLSAQQHDQSNSTTASIPSSPIQPLQIIQQHQQSPATTVQYCNNNGHTSFASQSNSSSCLFPQSPPLEYSQQVQYQRNTIIYRKPATVRLRPKDATTQTDPTEWVNNRPKKSLRFSQKFIEYLSSRSERHGTIVTVS